MALYIIQDGPHWGPMDPCGGPVGMYSQTGDWAPESPMAAIKVIFEGPLEAQKYQRGHRFKVTGSMSKGPQTNVFYGEKIKK